MRFEFIRTHRHNFQIQLMCQKLNVSSSGYYAWRERPLSQRGQEDANLLLKIEEIHQESLETYGYRRIYQALLELDRKISRRRIVRLMRQKGLRGKQFRRYVVTTKPGKRLPNVPDRLERRFKADRPNEAWVADITYVRTGEGWLYVAAIVDLFSRRVVGWAMGSRLTNDLTLRALRMALRKRQPSKGLIHHSDHGTQYTSHDYQQLLASHQALPSFGKVGSCYDNAAMESFFGTLKSEWLYFHRFETRQQAMSSIFYFIEAFYNRSRLHSTIGYQSPLAFEQAAYLKEQSDLNPSPL
jgi:putative transposase